MAEDSVIIETGVNTPDACVIWLHGLGADGHDFEPIVPELRLDPGLAIRFVFPHAPMMPVTINQGFVMRAWYDIRSASIDTEPDETGIRSSMDLVTGLLDDQVDSGIASERIILAGFSQGGAIALQTGLGYFRTLAGIIALSTYLPLPDSLENANGAPNGDIPIFLAHGSADPVVPVELGHATRAQLDAAGYTVEWHEYQGMPHSVSEKEIYHIAEWIEKTLT